jgi:hypothetical protein
MHRLQHSFTGHAHGLHVASSAIGKSRRRTRTPKWLFVPPSVQRWSPSSVLMFAAFNGIDDSVFQFSLVRSVEYCWLLFTLHMGMRRYR